MAYVYVLRSGTENIFKIRRTKGDVGARILQLSTGNPHPLTRFDVIETEHDAQCESYLHRRLSMKRINSGPAQEFFAITPAELNSPRRGQDIPLRVSSSGSGSREVRSGR